MAKRYVAELENDFQKEFEKKSKANSNIPYEISVRAMKARNAHIAGLIMAKEAVRSIMDAWNELDMYY